MFYFEFFKFFTINNLIHAKIPIITPKIIHPEDNFRLTIRVLKVNNVIKLAKKTNKYIFKFLISQNFLFTEVFKLVEPLMYIFFFQKKTEK